MGVVKILGWVGMSKVARNAADRKASRRGGINNAVLTRKITDEQVWEIRVRWATGETIGAIAPDYPLSKGAVRAIAVGRTYASVLNPNGTRYIPPVM